jgi:hypothetical protein
VPKAIQPVAGVAIAAKTVLTEDSDVEIAVPRDRGGIFEPQLIAKGQTHLKATQLTSLCIKREQESEPCRGRMR